MHNLDILFTIVDRGNGENVAQLLRHEGVGPVIGGGAEGFQLFVAPAEALGSVRSIAQRGDAGLHPFDSLHRAGSIKQRHGGGRLRQWPPHPRMRRNSLGL